MAHYSNRKAIDDLVKDLKDQGWRIEMTANAHLKCIPPDKTKRIIIGSCSEDPRALRNFKADLRRQGADI